MMLRGGRATGIAAGIATVAVAIGAWALYRRSRRPGNRRYDAVKQALGSRPAVCVFLGSSMGKSPEYAQAARALGRALAEKDVALVYGGGSVGLMGILAGSCHMAGGMVIGVIPKALMTQELAGEEHVQPENSIVVESMHERKQIMASLSTAFITLPGGFGTLDEVIEAISWTQIGVHCKTVGFFNVAGFWNTLIQFFSQASEHGFIPQSSLDIIVSGSNAHDLIDQVLNHKPPSGYTNAWGKTQS